MRKYITWLANANHWGQTEAPCWASVRMFLWQCKCYCNQSGSFVHSRATSKTDNNNKSVQHRDNRLEHLIMWTWIWSVITAALQMIPECAVPFLGSYSCSFQRSEMGILWTKWGMRTTLELRKSLERLSCFHVVFLFFFQFSQLKHWFILVVLFCSSVFLLHQPCFCTTFYPACHFLSGLFIFTHHRPVCDSFSENNWECQKGLNETLCKFLYQLWFSWRAGRKEKCQHVLSWLQPYLFIFIFFNFQMQYNRIAMC